MERYDKDGDGAISYQEFSDEITPHSPKKTRYWVVYIFLSLTILYSLLSSNSIC